MIYESFIWSKNQLHLLLNNDIISIHLTTDLWTAKSRQGYLGITITWLTSNFEFREALLSCNHLPYPHSGEVISTEIFEVLNDWHLIDKVFTIATDNGANMIKAVRLLKERYVLQIERQPCAAHTLQLSVLEGLKQCKLIHRRVKYLQAFFHLPKQAQWLREAQKIIGQFSENDNNNENPLNVLTDVKTRWNSTYYAWKRILELHNSMRYVLTSLLAKADRLSQQEGEKLGRLCLSIDEKQ